MKKEAEKMKMCGVAYVPNCFQKFPPYPGPISSDVCLSSEKSLWLQKNGEGGEFKNDIMTRFGFEKSYNPRIVYEASCRIKEMGVNREPERFLQMKFTSDPLHIDNHATFSDSFQSTLHSDMRKLDKEACEQFNSLLYGTGI